MLTVEDVACSTRRDKVYESNLLSAVAKGHRAQRDQNPYKQEVFHKAWHFGHFNRGLTIGAVMQGWLEVRKKEWDEKFRRMSAQPPQPPTGGDARSPDKSNPGTTTESRTFHPDDFKLERFDWKLIPPGSPFWSYWNDDKYAMKADGYHVSKTGDGFWIVCKEAPAVSSGSPKVEPPEEHRHTSANVVAFPASRIVRRIEYGVPVTERKSGSSAA